MKQQNKPSSQSPKSLSAVFNRHAGIGALLRGLGHQAMCGGLMLGGHLLAGPVPVIGAVMSYTATNIDLSGLAAWCWYNGDRHWRKQRGSLSKSWEKIAARGTIAAAGLGMISMHLPGLDLHEGHHHAPQEQHEQHEHHQQMPEQHRAPKPEDYHEHHPAPHHHNAVKAKPAPVLYDASGLLAKAKPALAMRAGL